jgi:hypothetical protein
MNKNVGKLDTIVRLILGIALIAAYLLHFIQGTVAIILAIFGLVLILTGTTGFCPLYLPFNINTNSKEEKENK